MSKQAVDKGHDQFMAAMKASDAAALAAVLTEDVVFCPPHEPTRTGKPEVQAWARDLFDQIKTERVSVSDRNVVVAGNWAFETGSFVWAVSPVQGGETTEDRGRFLAIWQRQPDGSWKASYDIWNSVKPLPSA